MTRYRLRRRARGWAIQKRNPTGLIMSGVWLTIATHRFHWLATLRLWFLRERERSRTGYRGRSL